MASTLIVTRAPEALYRVDVAVALQGLRISVGAKSLVFKGETYAVGDEHYDITCAATGGRAVGYIVKDLQTAAVSLYVNEFPVGDAGIPPDFATLGKEELHRLFSVRFAAAVTDLNDGNTHVFHVLPSEE
jgi:hypothetical protein